MLAVVVMVVISLHPGPRSNGLAVERRQQSGCVVRRRSRTSRTPALAAARQAASFAIIPALAVPALTIAFDAAAIQHRQRWPGGVEHAGGAARDDEPAAFNRAARLPASVSALTLNSAPAFAALMLARTGTKPAAASAASSAGRGVASAADAPRLTVRRRWRRWAGPLRPAPPGVGAGQADGQAAGGIDRGDQPRVQRAGEHLHDDVERRLVGHAQPVDLVLGDAGGGRARSISARRRARRPAGRARPLAAITGQRLGPRRVFEQLAAELEHRGRAHSNPRALVGAEQQVEVLDGLSGGALHQVVDGPRRG